MARGQSYIPYGRTPKKDRRLDKLVTGTNWPPRTEPTPGKGYLFFQGPTPKTAVQPDMPGFFSAENFEDLEITPTQTIVTGTGLASAAILAFSLAVGTPTMPSAPPAPPPAVTKAAPEKKEAPKPAAVAPAPPCARARGRPRRRRRRRRRHPRRRPRPRRLRRRSPPAAAAARAGARPARRPRRWRLRPPPAPPAPTGPDACVGPCQSADDLRAILKTSAKAKVLDSLARSEPRARMWPRGPRPRPCSVERSPAPSRQILGRGCSLPALVVARTPRLPAPAIAPRARRVRAPPGTTGPVIGRRVARASLSLCKSGVEGDCQKLWSKTSIYVSQIPKTKQARA